MSADRALDPLMIAEGRIRGSRSNRYDCSRCYRREKQQPQLPHHQKQTADIRIPIRIASYLSFYSLLRNAIKETRKQNMTLLLLLLSIS